MDNIYQYGTIFSANVKMDGVFDYPRIIKDRNSELYDPFSEGLHDFVYLTKEDAAKEGIEHNEYILRVTQHTIDEIKEQWGSGIDETDRKSVV